MIVFPERRIILIGDGVGELVGVILGSKVDGDVVGGVESVGLSVDGGTVGCDVVVTV